MSTSKQFTPAEREEIKKFKNKAGILMVIAIAVVAILGYAVINGKIDFGKCQNIKAKDLTAIGARIKYVLQHATPGVAWLLFCMSYVGSRRTNTPAVNPMAGYEHLTFMAKNIALNSLEQFLMSVFSQLILVTFIEPSLIINIIPLINLLFITGRIFFFLGYPKYRSFGMMLTSAASMPTIIYISYRYFKLYV